MINRDSDEIPHQVQKIRASAYLPLPLDGWQTRLQIASYWDQVAPDYCRKQRQFLEREKERAVVEWKLLFHDLIGSHSLRILDAGCGPGVFSVMLCEMGHFVTGVDLSHPMIAAARKLASEKNVSPTLKRGDLEFLLFDDSSFDIVFCCDVFRSVIHPQRVIHEFRRVLRPDGRVILIDKDFRFPSTRLNTISSRALKGLFTLDSVVRQRIPQPNHNSLNTFRPFSQPRSPFELKMLKEGGFELIIRYPSAHVPSFGYGSRIDSVLLRRLLVTAVKCQREK